MTKTLILSPHVTSALSSLWRRMQKDFVISNSKDCDYRILANGLPDELPNVIASIDTLVPHAECLSLAIDLFRTKTEYDRLLILDSDCFPIRSDWQTVLEDLMGNKYEFAAPMRIENLDKFPHPCAFYMKRSYLDLAEFGESQINNILGQPVMDVGGATPIIRSGKQIWLPLIKTNTVAPHCNYSTIYSDLFYHHGAGSRNIMTRATTSTYYKHMLKGDDHRKIYNWCTTRLREDPQKYFRLLRGISDPTEAQYGFLRS